jgi:hypothetical protein
MGGRRPSGAPLALSPEKDDPELGGDPNAATLSSIRLTMRYLRNTSPSFTDVIYGCGQLGGMAWAGMA